MPKVPAKFAGGAGITEKPAAGGDDLRTVLASVVDDLNALKTAYDDLATKFNAAVTLANELKADYGSAQALVNDLKAKYNAAVTEIADLRARTGEARTLANEVKADHNALLAKLDADAGVTDTNYAALHAVAATDVAAVTAPASAQTILADAGAVASVDATAATTTNVGIGTTK